MANSPKPVYRPEMPDVYVEKQCASKLIDGNEVSETTEYDHTKENFPGFVKHRYFERTSKDGTCIVCGDFYQYPDGSTEEKYIFIEIENQQYYPVDYRTPDWR